MIYGRYPTSRPRRLRQASWVRALVGENKLSTHDLIWSVFLRDENVEASISSMPGIQRFTVQELVAAMPQAVELGIKMVALFPFTLPSLKDPLGKEALNPDNLVCQAIRAIKALNLDIGIMTDVALDPYTSHGHDGILVNGNIANDQTIEILREQALNQARAGSDVLGPSDMMDGRIGAIRHTLDHHGFHDRLIASYAIKYASSFYGPFRQAIGMQGLEGPADKKTYQMDMANSEEAIREALMDIEEGADMLIIKPGLPYIDIIQKLRPFVNLPMISFQISGEYAMIQAAHLAGCIDGVKAMDECLMSMKRAGATAIITYDAINIAKRLQ